MVKTLRILGIILTMALLNCCAAKRPETIGIQGERLSACPDRPCCVSSDADDESQHIEPYRIAAQAALVWDALRETVAARPRVTLTNVTDNYLHAEERSRLLGFVDDLEFHLRPEEQIIAVRSASRLGYYDFGVNRDRVEAIRAILRSRGLVR